MNKLLFGVLIGGFMSRDFAILCWIVGSLLVLSSTLYMLSIDKESK